MRGRKATPTALKRLRGNPGKRKLPEGEPVPAAAGVIAVPAHLGKEAAQEWDRIVAELQPLGLVSKLDLGLLEAWCAARGDFIRAERELKRQGPVIKDRDGNQRRNPWLFVKSKAIEQMVRIGSEFGLSPASRPRLGRAGAMPPSEGAHGSAGAAAPQGDTLDRFLAAHPEGPSVH